LLLSLEKMSGNRSCLFIVWILVKEEQTCNVDSLWMSCVRVSSSEQKLRFAFFVEMQPIVCLGWIAGSPAARIVELIIPELGRLLSRVSGTGLSMRLWSSSSTLPGRQASCSDSDICSMEASLSEGELFFRAAATG